MKKFLTTLVAFLFLPLVLLVAVDMHLRTMNTSYKEKLKGLEECKDSVEVLILGTSHATNGVDPAQIDMFAYNLASDNQSIYFDKRLTLRYLDQLPKLKYALISIDYHSLYFSSQGVRDVWSYYGHGIPYKGNTHLKERISPFLFGYTPKIAFITIVRDIKRRIKYRGQVTMDFDVSDGIDITKLPYRGFYAGNGNPADLNEDLYKVRIKEFWWVHNEPSEYDEVLADLEDFIQTLQSRGVTPVLYACPTYAEYNKLYDPAILARNAAAIKMLTEKYDIACYDHIQDKRFGKDMFGNCDHLNLAGSKMFSKILNEELNALSAKAHE